MVGVIPGSASLRSLRAKRVTASRSRAASAVSGGAIAGTPPGYYASLIRYANHLRYNRAFFEAVHVEDRQVARVTYREPFAGLLTCGFSKTPFVPPAGIEPATRGLVTAAGRDWTCLGDPS